MSDQLKVKCVECNGKFLIVRSMDIPPADPGEAFQRWCPYCREIVWVEIALKEEKEEETPGGPGTK